MPSIHFFTLDNVLEFLFRTVKQEEIKSWEWKEKTRATTKEMTEKSRKIKSN